MAISPVAYKLRLGWFELSSVNLEIAEPALGGGNAAKSTFETNLQD